MRLRHVLSFVLGRSFLYVRRHGPNPHRVVQSSDWSNVPYTIAKPIVAVKAMKDRETTVAVAHARMRCVEIPDKPKDAPKPLTTVAPVKITYKWVCWVKTTWHLGARSGTIEKRDILVDTENPDAKGIAMGLAILQVQERAKLLLFGKNDKPTWGQTDVDCEH